MEGGLYRDDDPRRDALGDGDVNEATERLRHWESIYRERDVATLSWYEDDPATSLSLIELAAPDRASAIIDVGAGASLLVDRLVARGYRDVSVLDLSATALAESRQRAGELSTVTWVEADVLSWEPSRRYDLWHDRAVFHFLQDRQIDAYRATLERALRPGGRVVVGTFALDGPQSCSGLPTQRYDADGVAAVLGDSFRILERRRSAHITPAGVVQPFSWIVASRS